MLWTRPMTPLPLAKIAAGIGFVLLLVVGLILFGHARYDAGVEATDAKWYAASDKLQAQAAKSATAAGTASAARQIEYQAKLENEKERLDEAEREGSSPFDVLFGAGG